VLRMIGVFNLGLSVSDEDLSLLNLVDDEFNGHWNYTIRPQRNMKFLFCL
jgi:hypothetical protein